MTGRQILAFLPCLRAGDLFDLTRQRVHSCPSAGALRGALLAFAHNPLSHNGTTREGYRSFWMNQPASSATIIMSSTRIARIASSSSIWVGCNSINDSSKHST